MRLLRRFSNNVCTVQQNCLSVCAVTWAAARARRTPTSLLRLNGIRPWEAAWWPSTAENDLRWQHLTHFWQRFSTLATLFGITSAQTLQIFCFSSPWTFKKCCIIIIPCNVYYYTCTFLPSQLWWWTRPIYSAAAGSRCCCTDRSHMCLKMDPSCF